MSCFVILQTPSRTAGSQQKGLQVFLSSSFSSIFEQTDTCGRALPLTLFSYRVCTSMDGGCTFSVDGCIYIYTLPLCFISILLRGLSTFEFSLPSCLMYTLTMYLFLFFFVPASFPVPLLRSLWRDSTKEGGICKPLFSVFVDVSHEWSPPMTVLYFPAFSLIFCCLGGAALHAFSALHCITHASCRCFKEKKEREACNQTPRSTAAGRSFNCTAFGLFGIYLPAIHPSQCTVGPASPDYFLATLLLSVLSRDVPTPRCIF